MLSPKPVTKFRPRSAYTSPEISRKAVTKGTSSHKTSPKVATKASPPQPPKTPALATIPSIQEQPPVPQPTTSKYLKIYLLNSFSTAFPNQSVKVPTLESHEQRISKLPKTVLHPEFFTSKYKHSHAVDVPLSSLSSPVHHTERNSIVTPERYFIWAESAKTDEPIRLCIAVKGVDSKLAWHSPDKLKCANIQVNKGKVYFFDKRNQNICSYKIEECIKSIKNKQLVSKTVESKGTFEVMVSLSKGIAAMMSNGALHYPLGNFVKTLQLQDSTTARRGFLPFPRRRVLCMSWQPKNNDSESYCKLWLLSDKTNLIIIAQATVAIILSCYQLIRPTVTCAHFSRYLLLFGTHKDEKILKVVLIHHYRTLCEVISTPFKTFLHDLFGINHKYSIAQISAYRGMRVVKLILKEEHIVKNSDSQHYSYEVKFRIRIKE